jgi:hypothetical protein
MSTQQSFWNRVSNVFLPNKRVGKKAHISPGQMNRIRQDAVTRKQAIEEAELSYYPFRVKLQRLYLNTAENGHIMACVERRKDLTLLRKWEFKNASGEVDKKVTDLFFDTIDGKTIKKAWFNNFISFSLDAIYYGYSLIYLGDIVNNEFVNSEVIKRWHVSPDRYIVSSYEYMTTGVNFLENEEIKDYYVYVPTPNKLGTSPCGYGIYYELSLYENLMRNLLGLNADYLEVNIAPFRQIKTYKTEERERAELEQIARDMGSNGYALTDPEDEIIFHPSGGSGTGYNAFDNSERRLEDKASQIILGHADAIKSIPGKLGNDGEESPAQQALEDKQTKDGEFILAIVNKTLFDKMRALGFNIPEGTTACMLNDNEENENAQQIVNIAVEMKKGGLQMDAKYFTEKTKIPVSDIQPAVSTNQQNLSAKITNKLKSMYGKTSV